MIGPRRGPPLLRGLVGLRGLLRLFGLLGLLTLPAIGWAQDGDVPEIVGVQVGLGGYYRAGTWTAVRVTLRGGSRAASGQISLTVPDGDGVPSRATTPAEQPCLVPAGERRTFDLYTRFGRVRSRLDVEFRAEGGTARRVFTAADQPGQGQFPAAVANHRGLVVTVATDSLGVEEAFNLLRLPPPDQAVVGRLEDAAQLPTQWYGYEGIDALVLCTSQPKLYADLKPDGPQAAALEQWVQMGGKLILCVGSRGGEVLRDGTLLARFAPGRFQKMVPFPQTDALEAYAGSSVPVPDSAGGRHELRVPHLTQVEGTIEARKLDLPLVIRQARGFGQVVFLAADPELPPFRQWSERGLLLGKLLDNPPPVAQDMDENRAIMHYGYTDLAGQLRSSLDQFPGVGMVPFWVVVGLIGAYIFLIGPGDYLLLRKVLRRMQWTWVTFPLVVVAFGVGAYGLACWSKGSRLHVSQVDLVDCDAVTGRARGTTWANLFSPKTDRYQLAFQPRSLDGQPAQGASVLTGWLGLPGGALGGMDPRTFSPTSWTHPYEFSDRLDAISGLPIQVWSTKSLTARWTARTAALPQAQLAEEDRLLVGSITNTLDFPLADCILACGRWGYEVGTLKPGQSAQFGTMARRRELETLLTGRKLEYTESKTDKFRLDPTPLYDQSSGDPAYILRAMLLFHAAGGRRYTGLFHEYQGFVDLSGLLKTDRAILIARAPADASTQRFGADLLRDGQPLGAPRDRHLTFYRFVFPVKVLTPSSSPRT